MALITLYTIPSNFNLIHYKLRDTIAKINAKYRHYDRITGKLLNFKLCQHIHIKKNLIDNFCLNFVG